MSLHGPLTFVLDLTQNYSLRGSNWVDDNFAVFQCLYTYSGDSSSSLDSDWNHFDFLKRISILRYFFVMEHQQWPF